MQRFRTFLAIELPGAVVSQARKLIRRFSEIESGVRWVDDDTMHITLQFLGDVEEIEVVEVCALTKAAVEDIPAFSIQVEGLGAFPDLSRARTLWGGVTDGIDQLRNLQEEIEYALNAMRFPIEKRQYQPHVTLGRVRNNRGLKQVCDIFEELADYSFGPVAVDEVIIFSAESTAKGPIYTRMGTAELA